MISDYNPVYHSHGGKETILCHSASTMAAIQDRGLILTSAKAILLVFQVALVALGFNSHDKPIWVWVLEIGSFVHQISITQLILITSKMHLRIE